MYALLAKVHVIPFAEDAMYNTVEHLRYVNALSIHFV